jgi:amino acid transporter/nucleotide-binding universal stress UspA family protein
MLVSHQDRPRELKWYHAGPLLYGDWGTSRFYVLGLAFYYALNASIWYILGVGMLVAAVGWAYTVVCRVYPDGGGVYSAAKQLSPILGVIGALLLFANYWVTAALSAFEGVHYLGIESGGWVQIAAIGTIILLGVINYVGSKQAASFALLVAVATLLLTVVLVLFAIPHLGAGFSHIERPHQSPGRQWVTLVNVVLALSGVEAIANMTGIMVQPVVKTARKSILPVLLEVVVFNIILGIAMLALPAMLHASTPAQAPEFRQPAAALEEARHEFVETHPHFQDDPAQLAAFNKLPDKSPNEDRMQKVVLRVMGEQFIGPWFGKIAGVVFGLLLFSAVNTVIGGMVSVSYVMARDRELPAFFAKLNLFGVPWLGLLPAVGVPIVLLLLFHDLDMLADLYAIGVVGAIAINLSCCTINRGLAVKGWERACIGTIALVMILMELTLAIHKFHALIFVGIVLTVGLGVRAFTKSYLPARARQRAAPTSEQLTTGRYRGAPTGGRQAEAAVESAELAIGTPAGELDMSRPHVMVATRGGKRLIEFAANYAKQLNAVLFVLYVRQLNVQFEMGAQGPTLAEDAEARSVFQSASETCAAAGVQMVPIYAVSRDVPYTILDFAATYDVRALLMGVSREGAVLRALRGDVLTQVADGLPQDIPLLIHA